MFNCCPRYLPVKSKLVLDELIDARDRFIDKNYLELKVGILPFSC